MYCSQCGTSNSEEAGHCETCGAPLLISAGARTCGQCGASLGDHDRFCTSCGAAASNGGGSSDVYDAADDFGELNIDDIQLDDLPDWLQGMAPSEDTTPPRTSVPDQPSPHDLPDWLQDPPSTPSWSGSGASSATPPPPVDDNQSQGLDHQPADQFSLVTDDDLPDWLKELSEDADADEASNAATPVSSAGQTSSRSGAPATSASAAPDRSRAVANLHDVPVVSRAWLAQGRQVDQSQVNSARQEFLPLDAVAGVTPGDAQSRSIWDADPVELDPDDEATRQFAVSHDGEEAAEGSGAGRGKLIARIAILVLLIIVALMLAYVFIQGI